MHHQTLKALTLAVLLGMGVAQAQTAPATLTLVCQVFYQPARSIWVRKVQLDMLDDRVQALQVDGLKPYSFTAYPEGLVLTAIDNERIAIDLKQASWSSDFRDHASGQGQCEVVRP